MKVEIQSIQLPLSLTCTWTNLDHYHCDTILFMIKIYLSMKFNHTNTDINGGGLRIELTSIEKHVAVALLIITAVAFIFC